MSSHIYPGPFPTLIWMSLLTSPKSLAAGKGADRVAEQSYSFLPRYSPAACCSNPSVEFGSSYERGTGLLNITASDFSAIFSSADVLLRTSFENFGSKYRGRVGMPLWRARSPLGGLGIPDGLRLH